MYIYVFKINFDSEGFGKRKSRVFKNSFFLIFEKVKKKMVRDFCFFLNLFFKKFVNLYNLLLFCIMLNLIYKY